MATTTDPRSIIVRLHRRLGLGTTGAGIDAAVARGVPAEVARLVDPAGAGLPAPPDAWDGIDLSFVKGKVAATTALMVDGWLERMRTTEWPVAERLAWFWHGHFVSAIAKVRNPQYLADQIRLFQAAGTGPFAALVRAVTIDPAMLVYLDLRDSTAKEPNENYGREMLELFTLGRTAGYTEADVQAAARALTGWTVPGGRWRVGPAKFVARRHDDSSQTLVGLGGVHDLDTTVAAVTGHPACAAWIAGRLAHAVIGPDVDDAVVAGLGERFRAGGLVVSSLVEDLAAQLAAGVDGGPVVIAPVPWLVMAEKACGVAVPGKERVALLRTAGQLPLDPPTVGGWPSGAAWFASSTVVARFNLASAVAGTAVDAADGASPDAASVVLAARSGEHDVLAHALGLAGPFGPGTTAQLSAVADPASRIVLALTSPEFVLA